MTDAEVLRAEIRSLLDRFSSGDLSRSRLERLLAETTVALSRAVVAGCLGRDDTICAEHHWAHTHLPLHRSILEEPEQVAVSLFATGTRLFYVRLRLIFGRPVTCDERDGTTIDEIPYDRITGLRVRRKMRLSEVVAGALVFCFALVFRSWLMITGTLLQLLGILGILHGALVPSRWAELDLAGGPVTSKAPLTVHALGKKSARTLIRLLRSQVDRRTAFR